MSKPGIPLYIRIIEDVTKGMMDSVVTCPALRVVNKQELDDLLRGAFIATYAVQCFRNSLRVRVPEDRQFEALLTEEVEATVQPRRDAVDEEARIDYEEIVETMLRTVESSAADGWVELRDGPRVARLLADPVCAVLKAAFAAERIPLTVDNEPLCLKVAEQSVKFARDAQINRN